MPWLDTATPADEGARTWQLFFKKSLIRRLTAKRIASPLKTLYKRHRLQSMNLASILLGFRSSRGAGDDPLLFNYVDLLLKEEYIHTSHLLLALIRRSRFAVTEAESALSTPSSNFPTTEERIFLLLANMHYNAQLPRNPVHLQALVYAITKWLRIVSEYEMGKQLEGGSLHTVDTHTCGIYEALGSLAICILGNPGIRALFKQRWWKNKRSEVVMQMENYDTHILQWINSQLAGRLRSFIGMPPYIALDAKGRPMFSDQSILASISEIPVVNSRAGLFVWLNAALTSRPLADNMAILSHLHARYNGDVQTSMSDLLVASFDVFTNAVLRKESPQSQRIIRSFICNKVPILISMLSTSMAPPMTADACIQMAFLPGGMITTEPLQPITPGATEVGEILKSLRLDFLQACALHGHLNESTVSSILQQNVALPRVTKYNKDSLLAQCSNNVSRLENIAAELDGMQGNAGAIADCIIQHVNNLCLSKDTMSLKAVCNELLKGVANIDIIMMFTQPGMILLPLCTILNDWVHDQEHTEFTPSYEEFASILLFSLVIIHRYDVDLSEIGLLSDSFISRLLSEMSLSRSTADLTSEQGPQLSRWIEGLFAVDEHGEPSGIGDDVMRQCSPQSFYQLVPTLFQQSVLACRSNSLNMKTFKGGLELLLEPFLLPSLIMGLRWMAEHSWEDHNDAEILLQILEKLLKPSSTSQETKAMHAAVVGMVATPLYDSLQDLLQKQPGKKKAVELSETLKRHLGSQRTLKCRKSELDEWLQKDGSLEQRTRRSIQELVVWAATSSNPPNPPPRYTYREFAIACQVLETDSILQAILEELVQNANTPIALDICTALICAPTSIPMGAQSSSQIIGPTSKLRDSVRLVGSNVQGLLDRKQGEAEALVRLGRRVEAQIAVAQLPPMAMPIQTADQIMQDLGMDLPGNGTSSNVDGMMDQTATIPGLDQQLDLSNPSDQEIANMAANTSSMDIDQSNIFEDLGIDMNQNQQGSQQMDLQSNQEEDIFAGLDMGMGDLGDDFFG